MVKIKQKKQLNLPQLIEWAWENEIKNERFIHSDSNPPEYVWVNENSEIEFDEDMILRKSDTFTVEVEEEITEDTVIPKMLVKFKNLDTYGRFKNDSINGFEIEEGNIEAFYILNDDKTLTLIWRDGKLVE
ncbi:hypothetical protein [Staphylococcus saprophyticus]|uniref:hypothetical protein n=1 Tax=Staphylococcus saprophyticus TaxID=29385 RepID=UPI003015B0A5